MHRKILLTFILISIAIKSLAGDLTSGEIIGITVIGDKALLQTSPNPSDKPSCAINPVWDYAFDITTDHGKATLSLALTAYTSKKTITVRALNTCLVNSNTDDLNYLVLK